MKQVKEAVNYWCDDTLKGKYLGQGVGVAVLDTGIELHEDFDRRIIKFYDAVNYINRIYDDNGHGTHVAGIIGGNGKLSKGEYCGIAPRCNLYPVKVLDSKGHGQIGRVMKGINWVLCHRFKYNIRIVNISVGALASIKPMDEARLIAGVEEMWDAGLVVVAAAGNYGPESGSITTPGISKKIITVGSSNDEKFIDDFGNKRNNYSGRGPTEECVCKPDVLAPGSYITSCNSGHIRKRQKPYIMKSGTSMATPIVSGAMAILLSKYPSMNNVEVKLRLRGSCRDLGLPINEQGWGMLDVSKLIK